MSNFDKIEVWGYKTYRPFRIYWMLHEYSLLYKSFKIGSRTGETKTKSYLKMNPKGKIPVFKHNNQIITESVAAVKYISYSFKKPNHFFIPSTAKEKARLDEWCFFSIMELDCLAIYTLRRHESIENNGLSNIYGDAPNAVKTARNHFDRMISACDKNFPEHGWLLGNKISIADIIFASCLMHCDTFNIKIQSKKVFNYFERVTNRNAYFEAKKDCFEK